MENVIIDTPERIEDDIEDFKLEAVQDEQNYTAAKIRVCRDPRTNEPRVFYSQELSRNFRSPNDPFGKRHLIKVFTPENVQAAADSTLEGKFNDTVLAFKQKIPDYSPLSDIHSEKMNLFLDEESATYLSDMGVNIDGLGEDFRNMESVQANPFMEEVSGDASRLKSHLGDLRKQYGFLKEEMASEFEEYADPELMSEDEFAQCLVREKVSDSLIQRYLSLKDQINQVQSQLGELSSAVFSETSAKIKLPGILEEKRYELFKV